MDKKKIEAMFAEAVKARVEKSVALGAKATWSMENHLDVATKVLLVALGNDPEDEGLFQEVREVVQATYNHSAFAQRLEKAFEKTGHFQREGRKPRSVDDALAQLAAQEEARARK